MVMRSNPGIFLNLFYFTHVFHISWDMKTRTNKFQKLMPHLKSKSKRFSIRKCLMEKMERKTEFAVLPPKTRIKNLHSFKGLFFFCCHLMKFHFLFWQKQMVNNVSMPSTLKASKFQMQTSLSLFEPKTIYFLFLP